MPVSISLAAHKHKLIAGFFYPIDDNPEQIGIITIGLDAVAYLWKFDTKFEENDQSFKRQIGYHETSSTRY